MVDFLDVKVELDLLHEFIEDLELSFQMAETHIIALEKEDFDLSRMQTIRHIFDKTSLNTAKLNLLPLSEILDYAIMVFDKFIQWKFFSPPAAELILLHMDRILLISKEIEQNSAIDLTETQTMVVSFQKIAEVKQHHDCERAINDSLKVITQNISTNTIQSEADELLDMFASNTPAVSDDSNTLLESSEQESTVQENADNQEEADNSVTIDSINVIVPKTLDEPILHAKEIIRLVMQDTSIALLSNISDTRIIDAYYKNQFILELGLAVNYLAGKPINPEAIAKGICLRDIALLNNQFDNQKTGKLSNDERQLLKQHPILAAQLALDLGIHEDAINAINHHHERVDGNGYPFNLKGDEISEAGKLTSIIDSFCAMINKRPHKKFTRSTLRAIAEINACIDSSYDRFWVKQFNIFMRQHWLPIQIQQQSQTVSGTTSLSATETATSALSQSHINQTMSLKVS
ncbi:MAG: HD domain-containing protein [Gammaproteobacteria bacterium]|nr:HD domain-containing protein [Gammaproteobacteria bacterium]